MQAAELSDEEFFATLAASGARVLLIGRRALILLGAPVMTADYNVWVHFDDVEVLNRAFEVLDHVANRDATAARQKGRHVIENGERIDVMVARAKTAEDGDTLDFETAWARRQEVRISDAIVVHLPSIEDLITTKRWAARAKDLADIQFLEALRSKS